ncbi:MAG: hypothetical protein ACI4NJ_05205 [Cellvibrio sp.]
MQKAMNPVRPRVFTRLLQEQMLGEVKEKPSFSVCIEKLDLKGFESVRPAKKKTNNATPDENTDKCQISKSAWSAWWYGSREISASYRAAFNAVTNNLASKWLEPCLVNNRLACHLCCFDLDVIGGKYGKDKAINRAWEILQTVHQDWQVNIRGEVTIFNGMERSPREVTAIKGIPGKPLKLVSKKTIINLDKNKHFRLLTNANPLTVNHYEPLNPSSIIPFLLCYALEAMHSETGLGETISIDLTSAIYACVFLLNARQYTYSNSGAVGKAAFALLDFWLNDNEASESDLWTLNHALGDMTGDLELDNLIAVRDTYREVMKLSGLSVTELGNLATKNLTSFN